MFVSQIIDEACEILATTDKSRVFRKLTQAVQTLMESGHYFHANAEVDVCTGWDGQTITLPRGIEVPLAVNVDGSPTYFRGRLFQYHVNKGGMYNPVGWAWDDRGFVSTVMDIRQPSQLVAVAEHSADAGLRIRVMGTDAENRPLRTQTEDGVGIDGIYVPIHALTDFPYGTIAPDGVTIQTREVKVNPLTKWLAGSAHQLSSGQYVKLNNVTGTLPSGVTEGAQYYVGKVSDTEVDLHLSKLDATSGVNPVRLSSIVSAGTATLTDARPSNLLTSVRLATIPTVVVDTANEVTFSLQSGGAPALPSPLVEAVTYFANSLDTQDLQVYTSIADATAGVNPVMLTGNPGPFDTNIRKAIAPQTKLILSTDSIYSSGDVVQASTNGGVLPIPLVAGQNYYVHQISGESKAVTLHSNYSDSISGLNPITLTTTGSGQNSIAKILPATAIPGTSSNIAVTGFSLPTATGTGAVATAVVTGPVTSATIVSEGGSYDPNITLTATISDAGGYDYNPLLTPSVSIIGGSYTTPATATCSLSKDDATGLYYISSVTMVDMGSGYSSATPPTIVFPDGLNTGGFAAKGTAVISGGQVTAITLNEVGSGAAVVVTVNSITNKVNSVALESIGAGYQYAPRITLPLPNLAPSPTITVTTPGATGTITQIAATDINGVKYSLTAKPTITITASSPHDAFLLSLDVTTEASATPFDLLGGNPIQIVPTSPTVSQIANCIANGNGLYTSGINSATVTTGYSATVLAGVVTIIPPVGTVITGITSSITTSSGTVTITPAYMVPITSSTSATTFATNIASAINGGIYSSLFSAVANSPSNGIVKITTSVITDLLTSSHSGTPDFTLTLFPATGDVKRATARLGVTTSFVSHYNVSSFGKDYGSTPAVFLSDGGGTGATAEAVVSYTSIGSVDIGASGSSVGAGYPTGVFPVSVSDATGGGSGATGTAVCSAGSVQSITMQTVGAGYETPVVSLQLPDAKVKAVGTAATVTISHLYVTTITGNTPNYAPYDILVGSSVVVTSTPTVSAIATALYTAINSHTGTTGYSATVLGDTVTVVPPVGKIILNITSTTVGTTLNIPTGAPAVTTAANLTVELSGIVTGVNVITQGTGYSTPPIVQIIPSTGVYVQFTSTGTLPSPLIQGNVYRAEAPSSGSGFTVKNADFSQVNITSAGAGSLYLVLARTFGVGFTNEWTGDFSGLTNADPIRFGTDYLLPLTSPAIDSSTVYYVQKISNSRAKFYTNVGLTSLISVTSMGSGQSYFALRISSYGKAYNNLITPSYSEFLSDGMTVQLSSSGSLPYPLTVATDYTLVMDGTYFSLKRLGTPVVIASGGIPTLAVGQMSLNIVRTFSPEAATTIDAVNSLYENGDQVSARADAGDTLPNGLTASSYATPVNYYARRATSGIELYDTLAHAIDTTATTGRISYLSTGSSVDSKFFVDSALAPTLIKSITHVEKPETGGYISLYAFDYGRSNDMALIGQYHPTETNPKYRRIRIGQQCAWARIIYRMAHPVITSVYDYIPLENERAILAALHACDLEDKDFFDQSQRYWQSAIMYLKNQNDSMEGHALQPPQINNLAFGDGSDPVMF